MALQETPQHPRPQPVTFEKLCCQEPGSCVTVFQSSEDSGWLTQPWLLSAIYGKNSAVLKREMIPKLPCSTEIPETISGRAPQSLMVGDKCEVHPDTREDHHTLAYLPTPTWGCAGRDCSGNRSLPFGRR